MTAPRLLRLPAVLDRVGLSRRTLLVQVDRGTFPKPVRPAPKCIAWLESEVDGWIQAKVDERDGRADA